MNYYIDVIVPLPLDNIFTYKVNLKEFEFIKVGFRVIVPFGKSKFITALVYNKHNNNPEFYIPKEIEFIIDEESSMNKNQLNFFKWISEYYMCPIGQVLKVGLPKLLLLKSESEIVLINENIDNLGLTQSADLVFKNLLLNKKITYSEIISILKKKNISKTINELLDYGLIKLKEEIYDYFKPKSITKIVFNDYPDDNLKKSKLLESLKGKKSQQKVVQSLLSFSESNFPSINDLIKKSGVSRATINNLIASRILIKKNEIVNRVQFNFSEQDEIKKLSEVQNEAFKEICSSFKNKNVSLLHGVTSSGKTEIYVKLINEFLKKDKQVLYLVPEIALTTQLISRLKKYFGDTLAVYHSKYSPEQRTEIWKKVIKNDSKARVVIGARSSIFLPYNNLGLIIVDEEHENAYKQFNPAPRYHARDSAIFLSSLHKAKTLLGSATPSLESYYNAVTNKYGLVTLNKRYGNVSLPKIIINDLKESVSKKLMNGNFSNILLNNIKKTFDKKEQVILFQNRRGHSPYLECSSCGFVYQCINCDVSLTYHQATNQLKCHHCGYKEQNNTKCKKCSNSTILKRGVGTQQVEEDIKTIFPNIIVKRMDYDTTRKRDAYKNLIYDFQQKKIDVLVGTQMIAKGLDFDNVSLVGILDADNILNFPDFRSHEFAFQLLTQVSGRSGRKEKQGEVILQTYNTEQELIKYVRNYDYLNFFKNQISERELFNYPPFSRIISITLKHRNDSQLNFFSDEFVFYLKKSFGNRVLGPEYPAISKIRNYYLKNILLKIEIGKSLEKAKQIIQFVEENLRNQKRLNGCLIIIDVDPL